MVPWPVTAVACAVSVSLGWALGAWMMVTSGSAGASAGVGESHRIANAKEETQPVRERRNGFDVLVEALAFDKLHGVEDAAVGERADVMNGDDAGMLEAGKDAGFAVETMREVAVGKGNVEDLDRK